jgi:hypothetical protein
MEAIPWYILNNRTIFLPLSKSGALELLIKNLNKAKWPNYEQLVYTNEI